MQVRNKENDEEKGKETEEEMKVRGRSKRR